MPDEDSDAALAAAARAARGPLSVSIMRLFAHELLSTPEFLRTLAEVNHCVGEGFTSTGLRLKQIADALEKGEVPR